VTTMPGATTKRIADIPPDRPGIYRRSWTVQTQRVGVFDVRSEVCHVTKVKRTLMVQRMQDDGQPQAEAPMRSRAFGGRFDYLADLPEEGTTT
jgi:hypothetical protein